MLMAKEVGLMSYLVPVLDPTNYPTWEVNVKSIMDVNDIWKTMESRALGEALDGKMLKQALSFFVLSDTRHGVANVELHRPKKSI